jgi:hypothetical protein
VTAGQTQSPSIRVRVLPHLSSLHALSAFHSATSYVWHHLQLRICGVLDGPRDWGGALHPPLLQMMPTYLASERKADSARGSGWLEVNCKCA